MNSPVDELNCKECGALLHGDWLTTKDGEFCNHQCCLEWKNHTRAESPDSVEEGKWSAIWIDAQDKQPSIKFWAESHTDVERICDALNNSADTLSPPPPVAADGELIERLNNQYESMYLATAVNHEMYLQAADFIKEISTILQSRSTPPPVAGGVVISREDAEEVLAYCNADFIAQGALLNSCVLQTLTAKAIVEGRRCRMGAIAAKLEAALGERNNG